MTNKPNTSIWWLFVIILYSHVWAMFEPCLSHVWATFEPRLSHAWAMLEACLSHAWAILELYLSHAWAMLEPCLSHVWAMFEPCLSHAWAMLEPLHPQLDFVPDAFLIFLTQELASKLPPSKPRNGGPTFCVFTRYWFTVVGFAVWEVGCLRADFNAFGILCHRCVHIKTYGKLLICDQNYKKIR